MAEAVCNGQFKCAYFNEVTGACNPSLQTSVHSCQGDTANSCNQYIYNCPGGCVYNDTCSWQTSGSPTNTPNPSQPSPTSGGGGANDTCVVAGKIERYDNINLTNASGVVTLWSSLATNTDTTDGSGNFGFDKNYNNVGNTIKVYVNNPYGSYRTFKVKGGVPSGCSKTDNDTVIQCPKSSCLNKDDNNLVFNFEEIPPDRPPECSNFAGDTTITKGSSYPYSVVAKDPDDGTANGSGVEFVQMFWRYSGQTGWTILSADEYQAPYNFTLDTDDITVSGASRAIQLAANVYKILTCNAGVCTTGNPYAGNAWTFSTACQKDVTVNAASASPTSAVCAAPAGFSVNRTCNGSNSSDALTWNAVSSCSSYQITYGNDTTPSDWPANNTFSTSSTSKTFTGVNGANQQCYRVKCANATTCSATGNQSSIICKSACASASPTQAAGTCAGIEASISRVCNASNNMQVTLNWTHQTGATNYAIAIDDDDDFWTDTNAGNEVGVAPYATETTGGTGNARSWTGSFASGVRRYFKVRTQASNSCTPHNGAYGSTQSTIITCAGPSPTQTSSCGGSIPSNAAAFDTEESTAPIPAGTNWTYRATDNATKCQYRCNNNFTWDGNSCEPAATNTPVPGSCGGSIPSNAVSHDTEEDDAPIPTGTNWTYRATDNATKCQYRCNNNFTWDGNSCEPAATNTPAPHACTGTRPANTSIYSNDDTSLTQDLSWQYADPNTARKCQYYCSTGYEWDGNSCEPIGYVCTGSVPANGSACPNDDTGLTSDLAWLQVASCNNNRKCQYTVAPTPTTTAYSCTGNRPSGTSVYSNDEEGLTSNLAWVYAASNTARKCQYYCSTGYEWDGNSCEPIGYVCTGSVPANGSACPNDDTGLTSDLAWLQVASCNNNRKCQYTVAPTNTPAPAAQDCDSPAGLSCGGSCTSAGDMQVNCTWTRDTRVSGFRFRYDDDSGFGTDATPINLTTDGTSANATYTMSAALPNVQHWFRVSNRESDGTCVADTNQTSNTATTGPATCSTFECTGTRPSFTSVYNNDESGLTSNVSWLYAASNTARKCQFYCNAGYTWNTNSQTCQTTSYTCGGSRPANTLYYNGDNNPTSSGVNWIYASSNTAAKCEFYCDTGYSWNSASGACELPANACVAPVTTTGSITCTNGGTLSGSWNGVTGAATYRYQRNTSASTTGAMQGTLSGTSFSVAIDEPDVTNYFRVRVQTVSNTATCTAPGTWSAWRSVAANTNCNPVSSPTPVATPTEEPTACERPGPLTITEACTPSPQLGSSWNKVPGVLRYQYQIKRVGEGWADRVDDGVVAQPPGSVNPVMPTYYPIESTPPDYNVRVRSVCSDGAGGETESLWRTGTSNFVPPMCGGPTPTPTPPPSFDITVNLRVTTDNICNDSDPLLTGSLDGRIRIDPPDPAPIYYLPTENDGSLNDGQITLTDLTGNNTIRPTWGEFGDNDDPAYARTQLAGCSNPFSQTASVDDPIDSELNFYFSEVSGPWWQSSFGDVYGNVLSSAIPPNATNSHLSISSGASGGSEAGAVIWHSTLDLSTGDPSQKGYRVGNEALPFNENYAYFESKVGSSAQNVTGNDINSINPSSNRTYRLSGNQTLSTNWNVTGKIVVMIDNPGAQLTVQGINPITIGSGGFVFFVVNGSITFSEEVDRVYGMFMARDDITILYDISNQDGFEGHGSFISTNGDIVSYRSLAGNDNQSDPATQFIYNPGLVLQTPNELKSNTTVWQEVAP